MKRLIKEIQKHQNQLIAYTSAILVLLLMLFVFLDLVKVIFTICIFIFLNILLRFYRRIMPGIPIEFELVIFGSLLTTVVYGFWAGFMIALFGSVFAEFLNQCISPYSLVNIGCYLLVPFIGIFISTASVVSVGMVVVVLLNVIIFLSFSLMGYDLFKNLGFAVTNIFFNYILFKYFAEAVLALMMM